MVVYLECTLDRNSALECAFYPFSDVNVAHKYQAALKPLYDRFPNTPDWRVSVIEKLPIGAGTNGSYVCALHESIGLLNHAIEELIARETENTRLSMLAYNNARRV